MDSLRHFYKIQYEMETARRQALTTAVAMPLGVISLVIGALALVSKGVTWPVTASAVVQIVGVALAGIFVLAAAYLVAKSLWGYEYGHLPTPAEIKTYYESLAQHYDAFLPSAKAKANAESEALEHLANETAKYADLNSRNNDRKSHFLHMANGAVLLAVASLAVASGPYIVDSMFSPPTPHKVEITNLPKRQTEVVMQQQRHTQSSDQKPPQPPAQSPTTTEKPSPPPGRLIKEHNDPNKQRK